VLLFSLARLPTGNLWDALLDPLLWLWAMASAGAGALRALRRMGARRSLEVLAPVPRPAPVVAAQGAR
jgi:hypothetical protein